MGFNWLLSQHGFIPLVYNNGDQNVLINDWYACLQVLSKQLTVWNAYLSLLGYNLHLVHTSTLTQFGSVRLGSLKASV